MKKVLFLTAILLSLNISAETNWSTELNNTFFLPNISEIITNRMERDANAKEYHRIYTNRDHCCYTLVRKVGSKYVLWPGDNTIERYPFSSQTDGFNIRKTDFEALRGVATSPDTQKPYCLPVHGQTIEVEKKQEYLLYHTNPGDTIYATRRGQFCISGTPQGAVLCHADNTFAIYYGLSTLFFKPGDWVEVGQAIGVIRGARLAMCYTYMTSAVKISDVNNYRELYPVLNPVLLLEDGARSLPMGLQTVTPGELTQEIITMDMSKREKKQWLKSQTK